MSNRRRIRRHPTPDMRAGARLGLIRSARADGCICIEPRAILHDLDLSGDGLIIGDVVHSDPECPLFAAGPAAPRKLRDLVPEA